jgi:signal transduction histidine kinase/AraC-like DNA-binding protein
MKPLVRIGLQVNSIDPYWVEVRETIWRACRQHNEQRGRQLPPLSLDEAVTIELIEVEGRSAAPGNDDYAANVDEIQALDLDALILAPESLSLIQTLLNHDLPVIALHNREIDHPLFTCPEGLYHSAEIACKHLAARLGGKGRVLIVGGAAGPTRDRSSRLQAALDIFQRFPAIEWLHAPAPWDLHGARQAVHQALAEGYGAFQGVFGLSDTLALAAASECAANGRLAPQTVVVGINGDPLAIAAIAGGEMDATVATSARDLAQKALFWAIQAADGRPLPKTFPYRLQLVTAQNVATIALERLQEIAYMPSRLVGVNRQMEEQRLVQMETSLAINRRLGPLLDRNALPQQIAELIREGYGYDHAQIFLWVEGEQKLVLQHSNHTELHQPGVALAEAGPLARAFLCNHAVFIPDARRSQRFPQDASLSDVRSRALLPIRLGGKTLGVLDLHSFTSRRHTRAELDGLQSLADQLGVAMRNAQLYGEALDARAAAERADHLKTRLLANVSHQLRAPLNVILGYSQAILDNPRLYGADLPLDLLHDLRQIQRSGEHLARLVNDLLDQAQAESGSLDIYPERVEPTALLTEVFDAMAGSNASSAVEWRLELASYLPPIHADPARLRQIVLNLLSNAAKFTERGSITLGAAAESPYLCLWVADTGSGIPKAQQQRLFESFSASDDDSDRSRRGIGLGLSVTHHLTALHGGKLLLDSSPGCGTLCRVYLPLADEEGPIVESQTSATIEQSATTLMPLLTSVLSHASDLVQRAARFMEQNYTTAISRSEIAAALGVSPDYVTRIFRRETGMSPTQFLARYRIAQAQKMLRETRLTITEVAMQVGIDDPAYFSRIFHQETGRSPQQYRKSTN